MSFIKVEVVRNAGSDYDSLQFTARDDDEDSREDLDTIIRLICDTSIQRQGGQVPHNTVRIDFKHPEEVPESKSN